MTKAFGKLEVDRTSQCDRGPLQNIANIFNGEWLNVPPHQPQDWKKTRMATHTALNFTGPSSQWNKSRK